MYVQSYKELRWKLVFHIGFLNSVPTCMTFLMLINSAL